MAPSHDVLCFLAWMLIVAFLNHSHAVFVSIDCGSNTSYTNDQHSTKWTGDDGYVPNGVSKEVSYIITVPDYLSGTPMTTLPAFPTLRKNCYTLNVEKGEKVLARASFFYGNYDGKDSPPTFELQFDGNFWATMNATVDNHYEYLTKANTTSICLAQTLPGHIPFISALELRSLNSTIHRHVDPNHALFYGLPSNFGHKYDS